MLTTTELNALFDRLQVTPRGREIILAARASAPVRDVQSSGSNMLVEFPSRKMPPEVTLRAESRSLEQAVLLHHEQDPSILEYYTQPYRFHFEVETPGGSRAITHVPDIMTIALDALFFEESRSDERLRKAAEKYPWRYVNIDGEWHDNVLEQHLRRHGLNYRIRAKSSLPGAFLRNAELLADHCDTANAEGRDERLAAVRALFVTRPTRTYSEIVESGIPPTHLFEAVANGAVYVDISEQLLVNVRELVIYRDRSAYALLKAAGRVVLTRRFHDMTPVSMRNGMELEIDGEPVIVFSTNTRRTILKDKAGRLSEVESSSLESLIQSKTIRVVHEPPAHSERSGHLSIVNLTPEQSRRASLLVRAVEGDEDARDTVAPWTLRRAKRKLETASTVFEAIEALAPQYQKRGNRTSRRTSETKALALLTIEEKYNTHIAPTAKAAYDEYKKAATEKDIDIMAYPMFSAMCTANKNVRDRQGKRSAYQLTMPRLQNPEELPTPDRPFQVVHIDHTQIDLECISGRTDARLGKPWATLARDGNTKRVLGLFMTYAAPSVASLFAVIRDMVRRFGRVPESFVVDNGPDMLCHAMRDFCQKIDARLLRRPPSHARAGLDIERMFGLINVKVVHQVEGNSKQMKNPRQVSPSHHASTNATWTLPAISGSLQHACFELFDNEVHPELQMTPREFYERRVREMGLPANRELQLNREFRILTSPYPRRRLHRLDPGRGIRVDDHYFRNDALRTAPMPPRQYEVRVDPWNASLVYVNFEGEWIDCINPRIAQVGIGTRRELAALFAEWKQGRKLAKRRRVDEYAFFEWVRVRDPREFDARLREEHAELLRADALAQLTLAAGTVAMPDVTPLSAPLAIREAQEGPTPSIPHPSSKAVALVIEGEVVSKEPSANGDDADVAYATF